MVEVFKTNIENENEADYILEKLKKTFPDYKINFDLEDCDNILRIQAARKVVIDAAPVIELVSSYGFKINVLPDVPVSNPVYIDNSCIK